MFPIGPGPATFRNVGVGGRITSVAVNPANHRQVFIGGANGGVWFSEDPLAPAPRFN